MVPGTSSSKFKDADRREHAKGDQQKADTRLLGLSAWGRHQE